MIVALGFAVFRLAAKHLPVFPPEVKHEDASTDPVVFIDVPAPRTSQ
jgi:hypothetical protein